MRTRSQLELATVHGCSVDFGDRSGAARYEHGDLIARETGPFVERDASARREQDRDGESDA
jgi:hypothetical protein